MRFVFTLATLLVGLVLSQHAQAQSTSWTGSHGTNWKNQNNWTNGVPDATKDAIIGDGSFLGISLPTIPGGSGNAICKSLTVGASGAIVALNLSDDLTVLGDLTIGPVGNIVHGNVNLTIGGDWINNNSSGAY